MNCKHNYARVNEPRVLIQIFSMINRGRTAARKVNLHIPIQFTECLASFSWMHWVGF